MKKLFLAGSLAIFSAACLSAQDLDAIKTQLMLRQYKAAKPAVDKAIANEKTAKKPETWIMKSAIYMGIAGDSSTPKDQVPGLLQEVKTSLAKYKELDPTYAILAKESSYSVGPFGLYSLAFKEGVEGFNGKTYEKSFSNFKDAVELSDFLIQTKLVTIKMDTTSILYAGASAQNLKDDANAVKYFSRLADANVAGKDFEFLYQYLSSYYMGQKDDANFNKYVNLGKTLYPESKYFPAVIEEYANSKDEYYVNMRKGDEAFLKLYPKDDKDIPTGDVTEVETALVNGYSKAAEAKAEKAGLAYTNIANHFVNKGVAITKKTGAIGDEIKALNRSAKPDKTGKIPPVPKELIAKREALYKEYDGYTDQAIVFYEKAANAFSKQATLENIEKQSYKNAVSYLIDLNAEKKNNSAKTKPAESAKYAAQEKKWNDVYSKIK